jgi:hypothetical protein
MDKVANKGPSVGRTLATSGGSMLGGYFGGPIGSYLGGLAGSALSTVLGFGAYKVKKNSLMSQVPNMHKADESITVRHREYIQDVITSPTANTFLTQGFPLNPGLSETFPWLSGVAQQYQEYNIKGMIFEFVSTSADALNSTNTALGSVILSTQYRSSLPGPLNKIQALNEYYSTDAKPSQNFVHCIECDPKSKPLNVEYIRGGAVPGNEDEKTYDLGVTYISTVGFQGTSVNVGELWCTYEIELRKPIANSSLNTYGSTAHYVLTSPAVTTAYFGTSWSSLYTYTNGLIQQQDLIGLSLTGTSVTFPLGSEGNYFFLWSVNGTSTTVVAPTVTFTGCTQYQASLKNHASANISTGTQTAIQQNLGFWINITNPEVQAVITFSVGTLPAAATFGDLIVAQWNGQSYPQGGQGNSNV